VRVKELVAFIKAREAVRKFKESDKERTTWNMRKLDPIIVKYRFCNVHREDDRVTKWIASNWRGPHKHNEDLWFTMVVARLLNLPASLEAVEAAVFPTWNPKLFVKTLTERKTKEMKNFNAAYIVSTNGRAMDKVEYIAHNILEPLWKDRARLRPGPADTLYGYHALLMSYQGLGSFMAAQVVADLKYTAPLASASDWRTFAASGPGSRRGLNRVCGNTVDKAWTENSWLSHLNQLQASVDKALPELDLHAQDLQNCLCEYDKYERVRLGEGVPKQLYKEEKK
jgi:hypothetical protein